MAVKTAAAVWKGTLKEGSGSFSVGTGTLQAPYTFKSRFEDDMSMTNPEELIGAAHASCYAMFLSAQLTNAGFPPVQVQASANVHFGRDDKGPVIQKIELIVEAQAPGVSQAQFDELAEKSKVGCPISRALAAVPMELTAKLVS